jgi:hypothetical protein
MILETLKRAILGKRCVTGRHKGSERHFAPHAVGFTADGTPAAFVYQYGGETSSHLPPQGDWRCFLVHDLADLRPNDHRWRTAPNYSLSRQTCLADIVVAVAEGPATSL